MLFVCTVYSSLYFIEEMHMDTISIYYIRCQSSFIIAYNGRVSLFRALAVGYYFFSCIVCFRDITLEH